MLRRYLLLLDLFYSTHWNVLMDSTRRKPMVNVVGLWKIRLLFCFASFRVSIQCTSSGFDSFFWLRWGLLSSRLFVQEIIRSILFIIWFCCACILLTSFSSHSVTLYHTAWPVHPCRLTNLRIIFLIHFTFCVTANRGNLGLLFRFEEPMRISCSEFRQERWEPGSLYWSVFWIRRHTESLWLPRLRTQNQSARYWGCPSVIAVAAWI